MVCVLYRYLRCVYSVCSFGLFARNSIQIGVYTGHVHYLSSAHCYICGDALDLLNEQTRI